MSRYRVFRARRRRAGACVELRLNWHRLEGREEISVFMNLDLKTPLLDTVHVPADLRALGAGDLRQLADELRAETIAAVGVTGGHLGSGLGVVELTTAIHYVFD